LSSNGFKNVNNNTELEGREGLKNSSYQRNLAEPTKFCNEVDSDSTENSNRDEIVNLKTNPTIFLQMTLMYMKISTNLSILV
jgi:hypothetical protein